MVKAIRTAFEEVLGRANLVLIAPGVAVGYATFALVQAIVGAVIIPIIAAVFGVASFEFEADSLTILGAEFRYGLLISAAITFALVLAVAYFVVVAPHHRRRGGAGAVMQTRPCPECTSSIPAAARRCPRCTAVVQPESA
jgi:large conductance mechanosensitive channel